MWVKLISHLINNSTGIDRFQDDYYKLRNRLIMKYGTRRGKVVQTFPWAPSVVHQSWELGGHTFLIMVSQVHHFDSAEPHEVIEGCVERHNTPKDRVEAACWLYLYTIHWINLYRLLRDISHSSPGTGRMWHQIARKLKVVLNIDTCRMCYRGWTIRSMYCPSCVKDIYSYPAEPLSSDDDIPF